MMSIMMLGVPLRLPRSAFAFSFPCPSPCPSPRLSPCPSPCPLVLDGAMHVGVTSRTSSSLASKGPSLASFEPKRVLFLGTPPVAAEVLKMLHASSSNSPVPYKVVGVVTQPPRPSGRKMKLAMSAVEEAARNLFVTENDKDNIHQNKVSTSCSVSASTAPGIPRTPELILKL